MRMSRLIKIIKISLLIFFAVVLILFSASIAMQDKVADMVIQTLNSNVSTKINTGSLRFSLLRKFPNASVILKDVLVHSSPGLSADDFPETSTDTLLSAMSASVEIRMLNLLKKDYSIARITLRSGKLNLYTDSNGLTNYKISVDKGESGSPAANFDLNRISYTEIGFLYLDKKADLTIKGTLNDGRLKGTITGDNMLFNASSDITLNVIRLKNFSVNNIIPADVEIDMHKNQYRTLFRQAKLEIEDWKILMSGSVFNDHELDLSITGNNIDISQITNYFPERYKAIVSDYEPGGFLEVNSIVKGYATSDLNPHVEISFSLDNARIFHKRSRIGVDDFSFDGSFTNGSENSKTTSTFCIRDFKVALGSGLYKGSFKMTDFANPMADLSFRGTLYPDELKQFLNLRNVSSTKGTVDLDLRVSGMMKTKDKYKISDLADLKHNSKISFNSFGVTFNNRDIALEQVNGEFSITESTTTDKLDLIINDQYIKMSADLKNIPRFLAGKASILSGSANISAGFIDVERLIRYDRGNNAGTEITGAIELPVNMDLILGFDIDTLVYRKFNASGVSGNLYVKPSSLNFNTLHFNSQEGIISGNGLIVQNMDKSLTGRGMFVLGRVNINTAFNTFNNFGQSFLKAENIEGSLTGSVSVLMPADSMFKPDVKALTAEGKYLISNGALINFEPVKKLSSFIQLSELQNIRFDEMENDFFIRDYSLYIPQMDVRSSAADLLVSGKHDFDNRYEYHVKIHLSEILANKAKRNRSISSEFGEVEDDGLGRTSVFLKIDGAGKESKVSYDLKAAGNQIKNDIRKERENLRNILDEEYKQRRTGSNAPGQQSKPRIRVTWEGSDSTDPEPEPVPEKKESIIRSLFKKKL